MPMIDPETRCFIGPRKSFVAFWRESNGCPILTMHADKAELPDLNTLHRIYLAGPPTLRIYPRRCINLPQSSC